MIALVPTPARAAGLGDTADEPGHPPISTPAAVLMIGAAYLLFFGRGIPNALEINRTGQVLPALDHSAFPRSPGHLTLPALDHSAFPRSPGHLTRARADRRGAAHPLAVLPPPSGPPRARRHPPLPRITHPALATLGIAVIGMLPANLQLAWSGHAAGVVQVTWCAFPPPVSPAPGSQSSGSP
jgi:hypothetical protein